MFFSLQGTGMKKVGSQETSGVMGKLALEYRMKQSKS